MTQPDVVVVELCKSRINILSLDEETLLHEAKNINLDKIRTAIRQVSFPGSELLFSVDTCTFEHIKLFCALSLCFSHYPLQGDRTEDGLWQL